MVTQGTWPLRDHSTLSTRLLPPDSEVACGVVLMLPDRHTGCENAPLALITDALLDRGWWVAQASWAWPEGADDATPFVERAAERLVSLVEADPATAGLVRVLVALAAGAGVAPWAARHGLPAIWLTRPPLEGPGSDQELADLVDRAVTFCHARRG